MTPWYIESIAPSTSRQKGKRFRTFVTYATFAAVVIGAVTVLLWAPWRSTHPPTPVHYLGVYEPDAPHSYTAVDQFAQAIGRQPNLVIYYSAWFDPFQVSFATTAAKHGAITLVQLAPRNVSLADIASGKFDSYLRSYAAAVKTFGRQVILSFAHEMNGDWYSWGYKHTSAKVFVAAWQHIVTVFRAAGTKNVTWLWTINIYNMYASLTSDPAIWWPGSSYVNWVGIDSYYYHKSQTFAQMFGPTIVDVRQFTSDPIIIAETGASPAADQSAKITDLFTGVQTYGLLGFVWFDADDAALGLYWRLTSRSALATFSRDAQTFMRSPAQQRAIQHPSLGTSSS
jgi:mannan endo-1,4-beta-mannosidase